MNMNNFDMNQFGGNLMNNMGDDVQMTDTAEQIDISPLALLKMLKHARAGVPMEVMGLMLGQIIDDYTIKVVDVFAMPQSGTSVSIEAVDEQFQSDMLEMLKQVQRNEFAVGWYHSHPGMGCFLSGTDMATQKSYQDGNPRWVAVVIDPIQSVRGKVVMDAFRLISNKVIMMQTEPRQTTSIEGHISTTASSSLAYYHGLDKYYYQININTKKNELETKMLLNLYKQNWLNGLQVKDSSKHQTKNNSALKSMSKLAQDYQKWIEEEKGKDKNALAIRNVGKIDPKKHLTNNLDEIMSDNSEQTMGINLNINGF